jgi:glycosyltransferase involved in cell wall biosynthesis
MTRGSGAIRIGIDLTALMPQHTGVDTYMRELVVHLAQLDRDNHYAVFVNAADHRRFTGHLPPNFHLHGWCLRARPVRLSFQQLALPAATAAMALDVVHSPSFLMPLVRGRARHALTIHDMTFFSMPEVHTPLRRSFAFRRAVLASIRAADLVIVPSRATRNAMFDELPWFDRDRVRVVPYGISSYYCPGPPEETAVALRRMGVPERFVLYAGTIEPRKNLDVLLHAYRRLIGAGDVDECLLLAGRVEGTATKVRDLAEASDLRDRVRLLGFVERDDLRTLMRAARAFVYPSRYEGFGFPPLEAMACGAPVVATQGSALEENLGGAADLVEPGNVDALAVAMRRVLLDETLRARRIESGLERARSFRWEETARRTLACYVALADTARA